MYGRLHLHFCVTGSQIPPNKHRFESHLLSMDAFVLVAAEWLVSLLSFVTSSMRSSEETGVLAATICCI